MASTIGIRREDKSIWEARVPLVPDDIALLVRDHGLKFSVQSATHRAFPDAAFTAAGAEVCDGAVDCPIIMGVKEVPPDQLLAERTYVMFSHTIKGQRENMPLLRRLMELKCQLIDYEKIVDAAGRRLVFFGRYAGLAGMIDTLWALGARWQHEGIENPFSSVQQAHRYASLDDAVREMTRIGALIRRSGLPQRCRPLVCGFAGYGQVSQGAQEIYDLLPVEEVTPEDLPTLPHTPATCYKVVFREEHMVKPVDSAASFELQEYYDHPERYRGCFAPHVPHLTVLVNGIYWEPKYPRLITRALIKELYGGTEPPRLRVIGDITCDIEGSVECTVRATEPDQPVYVYEPDTGETKDGVAGRGPVILAVDHLPCELPVDASIHFSRSLSPLITGLTGADFDAPLANSGLPPELAAATIVYQGELAEPYAYLRPFMA